MKKTYIDPTEEAAIALFSKGIPGEVVMLNMIKFKDIADYSDFPQLAPSKEISGEQAYQIYMKHTQPFLTESGGELMFIGTADQYFIGPNDASWDLVFLVKQKSLQHFMAFATNEGYLAGIGHRTAAVADSRLLPIQPKL